MRTNKTVCDVCGAERPAATRDNEYDEPFFTVTVESPTAAAVREVAIDVCSRDCIGAPADERGSPFVRAVLAALEKAPAFTPRRRRTYLLENPTEPEK